MCVEPTCISLSLLCKTYKNCVESTQFPFVKMKHICFIVNQITELIIYHHPLEPTIYLQNMYLNSFFTVKWPISHLQVFYDNKAAYIAHLAPPSHPNPPTKTKTGYHCIANSNHPSSEYTQKEAIQQGPQVTSMIKES